MWALQSARLDGAVVVDLPGRADGPPATDLDALADACARVVARVEGPRVLVGHSLGGAVSLEVARRHPDLVAGVIAIASAARLPVPDDAMSRAQTAFSAEKNRLIAGCFVDRTCPMAHEAAAALDACGPETLSADYAACRTVELRGRMGGLRIPVLVIVGSDDPFTPPWIAEELCRELPMGQMVVIPGAAHMPMAEFGRTVNHLIAAYLARLAITLQEA